MSYRIAGVVVKNEYLALGTILSTIGITSLKMSGGDDAKATPARPVPVAQDKAITADSSEEAEFIRQFVSDAESGKAH